MITTILDGPRGRWAEVSRTDSGEFVEARVGIGEHRVAVLTDPVMVLDWLTPPHFDEWR